MATVFDGSDIPGAADHPLGEEESRRERLIGARCAHDDGKRFAVETDVERFLRRSDVRHLAASVRAYAQDVDRPHRPEMV